MTIKDTSLQAYWSERLGFRLGAQAARVLDDLHIHGAATRKELAESTGIPINAICGRVNELLKSGCVEEFNKTRDEDTNKLVWELRVKGDH